MKIESLEISKGKRDGEFFWICDYRYKNLNEKPIRHIKPTRVLVRSNTETTKRMYYSQSHFVPIGKNGKPMKKIIPLIDNTGYKTLSGIPVQIFTREEECIIAYADYCKQIYDDLSDYYQMITSEIVARQVELSKSMLYK